MTQQEMIALAKQAGFFVKDSEAYSPSVQEDHEITPYLATFAKLVAEKEREACAVICETYWNRPNNGMSTEEEVCGSVTAELIRARKQA